MTDSLLTDGFYMSRVSHPRVIRPTATLRRDPDDVLGRVLDIAGFAMHAILGIDLKPVGVVIVFDELVHTRRAVTRLGSGVLGQVDADRHAGVFQGQVGRPAQH